MLFSAWLDSSIAKYLIVNGTMSSKNLGPVSRRLDYQVIGDPTILPRPCTTYFIYSTATWMLDWLDGCTIAISSNVNVDDLRRDRAEKQNLYFVHSIIRHLSFLVDAYLASF